MNPITGFRLQPEDLQVIGRNLARPECVLAMPDGSLWASDSSAAVVHIRPDGVQTRLGRTGGAPNGIAMDRNGLFYIADIDAEKIYRLHPDGRHEVLLDQFDGVPLGAANFVYFDDQDRLWITVSTRTQPRIHAVQQPVPDGYILLLENGNVSRVGDHYCFTNEVRIRDGYLYVAETAQGRIVRHRLDAGGLPGPQESFGPSPLFPGARVDGIAFDEAGNLWVTEVSRNGIYVIRPEGTLQQIFEDPEARHIDFAASIAFAGPDRRTAVIGSIRMDHLVSFRVPAPGARMRHWDAALLRS
jgi:gluconolactonase